jgi:hypothetical protein
MYRKKEKIFFHSIGKELIYIRPGLIQISHLLKLFVTGLIPYIFKQTEINKYNKIELEKKCLNYLSNLQENEESSELLLKVFLNTDSVDSLEKLIVDCFPEIETPSLLENEVLLEIFEILTKNINEL